MKTEDVDILFLYVATYALSSTVLPVVQKIKCPIIILNIQPVAAIDYESFNKLGDRGKMTGEWLAHCQACSVPELANVFNRSGIDYEFITGYLGEQEVWDEIQDWIEAAHVASVMQNNRLGVLGHYYCGMLDVYSDLTKQSATFGTHIEILEMCEVKKYRDAVTSEEIEDKLTEFKKSHLQIYPLLLSFHNRSACNRSIFQVFPLVENTHKHDYVLVLLALVIFQTLFHYLMLHV